MNDTSPVGRVVQLLETADFRRMPPPLQIAGLEFEAPAVLIGAPPSPDLVVVGDTAVQSIRDLQRIIEGVGRALDVVRSRRPLTLVLVGPRPESKALAALSRHARVLPVGESTDDENLTNWLAVLLPLRLPQPVDSRGFDSLEELRRTADAEGEILISLARIGSEAVAEHFAEMVERPFGTVREDAEDDA